MNATLSAIGVTPTWLLPALLAVPLIGAVLVWLLPRAASDPHARLARTVTIALLAVTTAMSLALWIVCRTSVATVDYPWIEGFSASLSLAATGVSMPMVILTACLMLVSVLTIAPESVSTRAGSFYALILLLTGGIIGIFLAADLLLFYLCWELMLIPLYFLIGVWGSAKGAAAGKTFFIYTMLGSLLMLVAVVVVSTAAGGTTFTTLRAATVNKPLSLGVQLACFGAFSCAFLVKSALIPFHTWLPDAQGEGLPVTAVALGIKVGTYGMLALAFPLFPAAAMHPTVRITLAALGVVSIVYGSLAALAQPDFRRVVSYASIAHLGFVVLGLGAFTPESVNGALLVMVNAGITTGGMFLLLGMLQRRFADDTFPSLGGLASSMPFFGVMLVLFALANAGLPGTNGFVGEFLVLLGSFTRYPVLALIATTGVVLAATYLLWSVQRVLFGPRAADAPVARDLDGREAIIMACFAVAIIGLGLAPASIQRRMQTDVASLIRRVTATADALPADEFGAQEIR